MGEGSQWAGVCDCKQEHKSTRAQKHMNHEWQLPRCSVEAAWKRLATTAAIEIVESSSVSYAMNGIAACWGDHQE